MTKDDDRLPTVLHVIHHTQMSLSDLQQRAREPIPRHITYRRVALSQMVLSVIGVVALVFIAIFSLPVSLINLICLVCGVVVCTVLAGVCMMRYRRLNSNQEK